ncbi:MAG TPA: HAMP domain-containing sensor histidine kinase [Thermomicrobiales bacterium]|nr:HAMP domain-containing sensor histidine kinase [Thermomicrobiales bacterium]
MSDHSLRFRLLAGAAIWVTLALLLTGAVLLLLFRASVERSTIAGMEASLERLVSTMVPGTEPVVPEDPLADPRYAKPYGGLYWQIEGREGVPVARSRSLWDHVLPTGEGIGTGGLRTVPGPDGQTLAALTRPVEFATPAGPAGYRVTLAEDRSILDQTIGDFGADMALALLVLGMAILLAAWLIIYLGLRPLGALRRGLEAVRHGRAEKLADDHPAEVLPLVSEVNELLALRDRSVAFARARAADLAHGLKTPLQVLAATADRLRTSDQQSAAALDEIIAEMSDRIDYQLRLARLRLRSGSHVLSASLNNAISRSASVVSKTREGEALDWNIALGDDFRVNIDRHDLLELTGVVLENAAKWARSRVDVAVRRDGTRVELTVADDGPGLGDEQIAKLGVRGRRFDESRPGSGLGLAIALEILAMNGGEAVFSQSKLGGLSVVLSLPLAEEGPPAGN